MRIIKIVLVLCLVSLYSCGESGLLESIGSANSSAEDGSSQWDESFFPLNIQVSSEFSTTEIQGMNTVADSWSSAHGRLNFFSMSTTSPKSVNQLTDYRDNVLGIYKMRTVLPDYQSRALAITQIYADRINYDGKSYFNIKHADIVVNYADYSFSSGSSFGSYDLKTVILHELGHFVGLGHYQSQQAPSIMEPSIDTFDVIHYPYPKDAELIKNNYKSNTSVNALRSIASLSPKSVTENENHKESQKLSDLPHIQEEGVRIVHMLLPDETCEHYVDGKLVHKHKRQARSQKVFQ